MNSNFTIPARFSDIPIGEKFVQVLTICNEVAIRTEHATHQGREMNARRVTGKMIFVEPWEPVFVDKKEVMP